MDFFFNFVPILFLLLFLQNLLFTKFVITKHRNTLFQNLLFKFCFSILFLFSLLRNLLFTKQTNRKHTITKNAIYKTHDYKIQYYETILQNPQL